MVYIILGGSILQYTFSWLLHQHRIPWYYFWALLAVNVFYLGWAVDLFLPAPEDNQCGMPAFAVTMGILIFGGGTSLFVAFLHTSLVQAKEEELDE